MSDLVDQLRALLSAGKDVAQGASNAIAGNVSGPVDLISAGLRKVGLGDVIGPAPVGSSAWMAQKGLTREPTNALAGGAGETLGLLSPVAWAKAPQIANGLLSMAENAAKPSLLNPQMGAIVWHGSPHTFDKFDMSKIGTGEGAQAYGHGLYFADSPGVAKSYQQKLAKNDVTYRGAPWKGSRSETDPQALGLNALSIEPGPMEAAAKLRAAAADDSVWIGYGASDKALRSKYAEAADWLEKNAHDITVNNGSLYKVDLPDEHIAKMLDWDKPLSQQSPEVQKALAPLLDKARGGAVGKSIEGDPTAGTALAALRFEHGGGVPERLLRDAGIPGIKYLDQGSRGAGEGTRNYVVFQDDLPKILERNGLALK